MQRKLLTNGSAFKRTNDLWGGVVWYMDEHRERKRKSFSGTTKAEVNKKMTEYIADFENQAIESDEAKKKLRDSMQNWLRVFKFPSVEQTTYDRSECSAKNQIYPLLVEKAVGDITAADIKNLLNYWMNKGYAYTTVKKAYVVLNEYFRYLYREELISKNPMANVEMIEDLRKEACFGQNTPLVADGNGGYTRPVNFRKRYYRIFRAAVIEQKGLHSLRHTFATKLVNGQKQPDGTIRALSSRQVADLLGHSTSQITELYYVKKDTERLSGITEGFEM